jgi:DNA-binding NarL/FixJ family response regulator
MLARNELGHRLAVLIVLGDARRAERLAVSLSSAGDIVPILGSELHGDDAVDVMIVDEDTAGSSAPEGAPQVLMMAQVRTSGLPAPGHVEVRDRFAAILPVGTEPALVAAAARLAAAGYHIVAGARAAQAGKRSGDAEGAEDDGQDGAGTDLTGSEAAVHLSPREAEVLALLAEGAPNKVIARRLDISVHTAKFHVAAILVKLGAANRTDAIATAMRQGLVLV